MMTTMMLMMVVTNDLTCESAIGVRSGDEELMQERPGCTNSSRWPGFIIIMMMDDHYDDDDEHYV